MPFSPICATLYSYCLFLSLSFHLCVERRIVLSTWRCLFHLSRLASFRRHQVLRSSLRHWYRIHSYDRHRRQKAAIEIQRVWKGHQTAKEFPMMRSAAHFQTRILLARMWHVWHQRSMRIVAWHTRWQVKLRWSPPGAPHRGVPPFPSKRWRTNDGTTVMAEEYCKWRRKCVAITKWIKVMTMQGKQNK